MRWCCGVGGGVVVVVVFVLLYCCVIADTDEHGPDQVEEAK